MFAAKTSPITLKLLFFAFSNLYLCLKLAGIRKVIRRPTLFQGKSTFLALCHFEDQEVTVIDLYQKIFDKTWAGEENYLVLVNSQKGLYGITVGDLPIMREVDRELLRPVPEEYRNRDTLGIASHCLQVTIDKENLITAFLLDEERLLELIP